jgi:hydroxyethylthiazole kinase-like uncharacterized protein yjeF
MSDDLACRPEILTTRQMRAVEDAAIASGRISGAGLMRRAGAGVVSALLAEWPELAMRPGRAVVLCGPGNNGGDGYVVARLLAQRGWRVRLVALAPSATVDARAAAAEWRGAVEPLSGLSPADAAPGTLWLDALFGTGLRRPLVPEIAEILRFAAQNGRLVAVDVLSGICADSGRVLGGRDLPAAALTVSFHRAKLGHLLDRGASMAGALRVADIGLEPWQHHAGPCVSRSGRLPQLLKRGGHKYDHGHVLVLGGGPGRGGAARLAARAALRVGAGLVTLACPSEALPENAARLDAVMLARLGDAGDADALSAYAGRPGALFAMLHRDVLLTPHGGEFARLFPDLAIRLAEAAAHGPAFSRLDAARLAAQRAGCMLLLKGPDTVVAASDGSACIAAAVGRDAAPWLATAGSGDVLAGIIAGLRARGMPPLAAAGAGAWLHAEAARDFGPGLIAEDLPERIPAVLRRLPT